jgi:hypothetical protein
MSEVQKRANRHFNAIVEQMDAIRSISTDLVAGSNGSEEINWSHVGSLAHIRDSLADILEGWEYKGIKTNRDGE